MHLFPITAILENFLPQGTYDMSGLTLYVYGFISLNPFILKKMPFIFSGSHTFAKIILGSVEKKFPWKEILSFSFFNQNYLVYITKYKNQLRARLDARSEREYFSDYVYF